MSFPSQKITMLQERSLHQQRQRILERPAEDGREFQDLEGLGIEPMAWLSANGLVTKRCSESKSSKNNQRSELRRGESPKPGGHGRLS